MRKKSFAIRGVRSLILLASVAMLTVCFPVAASAGTAVYKSSFSGTNVVAYFYGYNGCVSSQTSVFATNGNYKDSVTGHTSSSVATLYAQSYDYCTGTGYYGYGSTDLTGGQLVIDNKLGTATLQTTMPFFDSNGSTIDAVINLTWTATSGPTSSKYTNTTTYPDGTKFTYKSSGTSRQAIASGTVLAGTNNFTPTPSSYAEITSAKTGNLSLIKG